MSNTPTEQDSASPLDTMRDRLVDLYPHLHSDKPKERVKPWDRKLAIQVLLIVGEMVSAIMDEEEPEHGGFVIVHVHPASELLRDLAVALEELDQGSADPRLRPSQGGSGRRYTALERSQISRWLEVSAILRLAKGLTHQQADEAVAKVAKRLGRRFRDKHIEPKTIDGWRRQRPGKRS